MWHLTSLPPDASFGFFSWARASQMIGTPFLFVPITTASYGDLPPEKTDQAPALINVARHGGRPADPGRAHVAAVGRASGTSGALTEA